MSDETTTSFTPEQISQQATLNANMLLFLAIAYVKEQRLSLDQFWSFGGKLLIPFWESAESVEECAKWTALNMVSLGAKLHSISGDESQAKVVLGGWPSEELAASYGITMEEVSSSWDMMIPVFESLGYVYEWNRQGDVVTITISS
jgi:hypothetical protein